MLPDVKVLYINNGDEGMSLLRPIVEKITDITYSLELSSSFERGFENIKKKEHDIFVLGDRLALNHRQALLQELNSGESFLPSILLIHKKEKEINLRAFRDSISDYLLTEDLSSETVGKAFKYSINKAKMVGQLKAEQELRNKIEKDLEIQQELSLETGKHLSEICIELRTGFTTILSSSSLLEKHINTSENPKIEKHLDKIRGVVKSLLTATDHILSADAENSEFQNFRITG